MKPAASFACTTSAPSPSPARSTARPNAASSSGSAADSAPSPSRPASTTNSCPKKKSSPSPRPSRRVFARLGEKKNRNTARLKFLVSKLGIEEFKRLVKAEREILPHDSRWTDYLKDVPHYKEEPLKPPSLLQIGAVKPDRRLRPVV